MTEDIGTLLAEIRSCTICRDLPLGPQPIVQFSRTSKILIVGQAPGRITHAKGVPFNDPSGVRLRSWLGISEGIFYDPAKLAIVPMGFCFPGSGKSGDLPPRPECAAAWRERIMAGLKEIKLTVIIGRYAIDWHLPGAARQSITQVAQNWRDHGPERFVLPHPSPRNNRWLGRNPWFEAEVVPMLQKRVREVVLQ